MCKFRVGVYHVWLPGHDVIIHSALITPAAPICTGTPGMVTKVYSYPGYCATVLQKSQKFRREGMGFLPGLTSVLTFTTVKPR